MRKPKTTLEDKYYFFNPKTTEQADSHILYKISTDQDADNCGEKLVEKNGCAIDYATNSTKFPCIVWGLPAPVNKNLYFFFQDYIQVGDTFENGKFKQYKDHDDDDENNQGSYVLTAIDEYTKLAKKKFANGYTIQQVKKLIPDVLKYGSDDLYTYNGMQTLINISEGHEGDLPINVAMSDVKLSDDKLKEIMVEAYNEKLISYANKLLSTNGFKLNTESLLTNGDVTTK